MNRFTRTALPLTAAALLCGLSACSSGSTASSGGAVFTTIDGNNPITAGAPMNPFNASGNFFLGYDTMQLGFSKQNAADPNDFFPGLAKSWTTTPTSVTIQLQPGAKWSDGTPVTVDDVKASMAIALTQGNAAVGTAMLTQGLDVADVKSVGNGAIEIDQVPGADNLNFTRLVLTQNIVPAEVYGSLLPSDVWQTIHASQDTAASAAAKAQAAVNALNSIGQKISAFAPKTDISAGPFVLTRVNPGAAVLDRNPDFYGLAEISPKQVVLRHYSGNEQIWGYMTDGELDAAPYTAIPSNVMKQITASGYVQDDSVSYVDASIAFNESMAPYNLTAVRQALAYLINRKAVTAVGEPVGGTASADTTGMIQSAADQWLTPIQLSGLNPYNPDQAKAAALLQGAGFTKVGNQWMLPDGKPWTITLQTVNGFSDWIQGSTVVANELTAFGIPTKSAITADWATYQKEMAAGKYAVGWWLTALGPQTSSAYQRLYGAADGYTAVGAGVTHTTSAASGNWQHTPTSYTVAGQAINPGSLTAQLNLLSLADQKPIVQQLAQATNQELPVIQIWDYTNVQFTASKRFTDFPATGDNALLSNPPGVWMMQGYVKAKK